MKKTLKQQAREVEKKILEDNEDFYNEIVKQYFPKNDTKPKRKRILQISCIAVACAVLIACITTLMFNLLKENKVDYLMENEVVEEIDIDKLKSLIPWFYINTEENIYRSSRTYDSLSGDNLYIEVDITNAKLAEMIKINLYINPKYKYKKELFPNNIQERKIKGVTVSYNEEISQNSYGLYDFSYTAIYKQDKNEIFMLYKQTWIDENSHFFEFLDEMIV